MFGVADSAIVETSVKYRSPLFLWRRREKVDHDNVAPDDRPTLRSRSQNTAGRFAFAISASIFGWRGVAAGRGLVGDRFLATLAVDWLFEPF